jgi:hypothetical protein
VIERSAMFSSETRVCSSIIEAILIALPSMAESNWKPIAHTTFGASASIGGIEDTPARLRGEVILTCRPSSRHRQSQSRALASSTLRSACAIRLARRSCLHLLRCREAGSFPLTSMSQGVAVSGSCRNVSGVVVGGVPGGGKSAWLALALGSLAHRGDVQWLLIDGKRGYDLEGLASRAYRYISGDEAGDLEVVRDSLQDIQTLMRERLRNATELYGALTPVSGHGICGYAAWGSVAGVRVLS